MPEDLAQFSRIVRNQFRARPQDLRMITVDGDSMEPLLSSGDHILIDASQQVPVPPGIFVIWDGMGLVAKRVEHLPNSDPPKMVIKSINPEYASYEQLATEVRVVGRAVWVARRLSLPAITVVHLRPPSVIPKAGRHLILAEREFRSYRSRLYLRYPRTISPSLFHPPIMQETSNDTRCARRPISL